MMTNVKFARDYAIGTQIKHKGQLWEIEGFMGLNKLLLKKLTDDGNDFERDEIEIKVVKESGNSEN